MLENLMGALDLVLCWENFFWAFVGVFCGAIMGAIPGLTDTMAIVLLLPFTYYLGPIPGIAMLMGLSKGGNFGGSLPAILFNIPGTPQAMCTTFDGHPLAMQGKSGKAMQTALFSSVTADALSDLVLIFLAAPVAAVALHIGPPEYSMVVLFSLVVISVAATADPLRGLLSTALGLLLATVGTDPEYGTLRFTFGIIELSDGISLMPMVIGLLAFSEVLLQAENYFRQRLNGKGAMQQVPVSSDPDDNRMTGKEFKMCLPTIGRSTVIGSIVGIVPGIGTTVGAYLSYLWARRKSKTPEKFGKGALEGIAASEAGNNAVNGPNLVPLVTLGIPGNLAAALILLTACGGGNGGSSSSQSSSSQSSSSQSTGSQSASGSLEKEEGASSEDALLPDASAPDSSEIENSDSSSAPTAEPQILSSLSLSKSDFTLFKAGATWQLKAKAEPAGGKQAWSSSDEKVATVDDKGVVTAQSEAFDTYLLVTLKPSRIAGLG